MKKQNKAFLADTVYGPSEPKIIRLSYEDKKEIRYKKHDGSGVLMVNVSQFDQLEELKKMRRSLLAQRQNGVTLELHLGFLYDAGSEIASLMSMWCRKLCDHHEGAIVCDVVNDVWRGGTEEIYSSEWSEKMRQHSSDDLNMKTAAVFVPVLVPEGGESCSHGMLFSPVCAELESLFDMVEGKIVFLGCFIVREPVVLRLCVTPHKGEDKFLLELMSLFLSVYLPEESKFSRDGRAYFYEVEYDNLGQAKKIKDLWFSHMQMSGHYFSIDGSDIRRASSGREVFGKQKLMELRLASNTYVNLPILGTRRI